MRDCIGWIGATPILQCLLPRFADLVIVVDKLRKRTCLAAGVRPDRLRLIPNGADPNLFRPGPKDPALLSKWGLRGRRVVLYLGKVNPSFDLPNVIRAMDQVVQRFADAALLVAGDGPALRDLKDLSARLGLTSETIFAGYQPYPELPGLIRASDVCLYPLRSAVAQAREQARQRVSSCVMLPHPALAP